ncbi:uncharacterized protein LOC100373949, partial [Saccoglossus kowalevskii]|uniref:Uncharacterized protein LOC100373949 n=1 Tax=Saccoglossus kowalevskii TaxID=10224 RepID=A0ABM0GIL3_SACKO
MSAGCGCVAADDGSCKHTAALLFAVAEYVDRQTDRGTAVSTDETCVWTKPRKTSIPVKVEDLDYRRDKTTPRKPGPQPKNYRPLRTVNNTDILRIQEHLKRVCEESHPGALFLKLVKDPQLLPVTNVPTMQEIYTTYRSSGSNMMFFDYLTQNTTEQHVEILKNLLQCDPAWYEARKGRITASIADLVRSVRDVHKCETLVSKILGTAKPIENSAVTFGKENEPVARQLYSISEVKKHKKFEVNECGLIVMKNKPFMGASPDGT